MMNKILTISVAAYNISDYIDGLMESIIDSDTMDSIEVLIINDGSSDDTSQKALIYQKKYPDSVRLVDKENGGHGSTINRGIKEAKGKYFRALDGDDWVNSENLHNLVGRLGSINSDIVLSDYCICYEDGYEEIGSEFFALEDGRQYAFEEIEEMIKWMRYHAVIYKTSILQENNIKLDEHCFYVDTEYMLFPIPFVNSIYYSKPYIYCYRLGSTGQSVSDASRIKNISNGDKVATSIIKYYMDHCAELTDSKRKYFLRGITEHCLFHHQSLMLFKPSKESYKQICDFENMVKETIFPVYSEMQRKSKAVKIIRFTHGLAYRLVYTFRSIGNNRYKM